MYWIILAELDRKDTVAKARERYIQAKHHIMKTTRFRVKHNLLDDLDFFTFPRKYINHKRLVDNEDIMDDDYFLQEKKELYTKLTHVQKLLLNFVKNYKNGDC